MGYVIDTAKKRIDHAGVARIFINNKDKGEKYTAEFLWYVIYGKRFWELKHLEIKGNGYAVSGILAEIALPQEIEEEIYRQLQSIITEETKSS